MLFSFLVTASELGGVRRFGKMKNVGARVPVPTAREVLSRPEHVQGVAEWRDEPRMLMLSYLLT